MVLPKNQQDQSQRLSTPPAANPKAKAPGHWPLASDYWPLAPGHWLLAPGHWLLAPGHWPLFPSRNPPAGMDSSSNADLPAVDTPTPDRRSIGKQTPTPQSTA